MGMSFDAASETDGRWQGFRFAVATQMHPLPIRLPLLSVMTLYALIDGNIVVVT
jgi:hypothetical protein